MLESGLKPMVWLNESMLTSNSRLSRDPVEQSEAIRPFLARAIILDLTPRWGLDGLRWLSIPLPDQLRAEPIEAGSEGNKAIKISSDPFQRSRAGWSTDIENCTTSDTEK